MNNSSYRRGDEQRTNSNPANRDAISGAHGSHPVGTGLGAAVQFVMDAFGHLKAIGHTRGCQSLLDKAGVQPGEGVVDVVNPTFVKAAARRFFAREPSVRTVH